MLLTPTSMTTTETAATEAMVEAMVGKVAAVDVGNEEIHSRGRIPVRIRIVTRTIITVIITWIDNAPAQHQSDRHVS
jgi:hypothetical protein